MQPLMIAGATISAIGDIAAGQQAAAVGTRNQQLLHEQADTTLRSTSAREELLRQRNRQALSAQRGAMLQAGLDPTAGTAALTTEQSLRDADLDALNLRYEGLLQARSQRMAGDLERWKGRARKRQANLSAASRLLFAGGRYMSGTQAPAPVETRQIQFIRQ